VLVNNSTYNENLPSQAKELNVGVKEGTKEEVDENE